MWLSSGSSKRSADRRSLSSPAASTTTSSSSRPTSPGSALAEVLRKNPFRASSSDSRASLRRAAGGEDDDASTEEVREREDPCVSLNKDLLVLAHVFPDVKVEVLRELLRRFDGDSRLPICTEQLVKYKVEWARGRVNEPPRAEDEPLAAEELFRTREYIEAVKWTAAREFGGLSKGAIEAVLAEVNFSYTHARPTLQWLASRSWKAALTNIFSRKKKSRDEAPSALLEHPKTNQPSSPRLVATGSHELDRELSTIFAATVQPAPLRRDQQAIDLELAQALNLKEAEEAGALFECQVCYNDVPFEEVSACTDSNHTICLDCVRRTLHEAIFGQGWAKSIDVERSTLKCLAPTATSNPCDGHVPQELLKLAVLRERSGQETWARFEDRLAEYNLQKSGMPVVRCPFCSYAEAEQVYDRDSSASLTWHFHRPAGVSVLVLILLLELLPCVLMLFAPLILLFPRYFQTLFYTALGHAALRKRTTRFVCRRPSCARRSCLKCLKRWHDPHVCHEPLIVSLRTTVEAARTAAVKRTCPRCGTSFVKSSGCNKLTCVCGYSMCYLCRKNIGNNSGGEVGYRHFCEHFRPTPGLKCAECDKCDLYRAEDEDLQVRRAGEAAERLWREREGLVGVKGLEEAVGNVAGEDDTLWRRLFGAGGGEWSSLQDVVDELVEWCISVDVN